MMIKHLLMAVALLAPVASSNPARACPVCDRETGRQVRLGIFDESFGMNLIATLLPFAVFLGIVAAIHGGGPRTPGPDPTDSPKPQPGATP